VKKNIELTRRKNEEERKYNVPKKIKMKTKKIKNNEK